MQYGNAVAPAYWRQPYGTVPVAIADGGKR